MANADQGSNRALIASRWIIGVIALGVGTFIAGWWVGHNQAALEAAVGGGEPDPALVYDIPVDGAPVWGPEDARVTIIEYSDFECPFCARLLPTLKQVRATYPDDVRIVFKHLPLVSIHPRAMDAHKAAVAAGNQGKFWEMHDLLYENPGQLDPGILRAHARALDLDLEVFEADLRDSDVEEVITSNAGEAEAMGVTSTPSLFINGRYLSGAQPFSTFAERIDAELAQDS